AGRHSHGGSRKPFALLPGCCLSYDIKPVRVGVQSRSRTKLKGASMTNTAMSARFAESDFRIGRVISQSASVLTGNFPTLFLIGVITYLPIQLAALWFMLPAGGVSPAQLGLAALVFLFVMILFSLFSQAVILHAAFQNMRNQPASISGSLKVGLRR